MSNIVIEDKGNPVSGPTSYDNRRRQGTKLDDVRVSNLLLIVRESAAHSAKLTHIGSAAMTELFALNEQLRLEAVEETKRQAKLKADADAKDAAKREAEVKADAKASEPRVPIEPRPTTNAPSRPDFVRPDEMPNVRPNVYPNDSQTATIADRRV